jgi:hypothetical protein
VAHLADPASLAPVAFTNSRLTPEEADRLAATFRPSWELDEAREASRGGGSSRGSPLEHEAPSSATVPVTPAVAHQESPGVGARAHESNGVHASDTTAVAHDAVLAGTTQAMGAAPAVSRPPDEPSVVIADPSGPSLPLPSSAVPANTLGEAKPPEREAAPAITRRVAPAVAARAASAPAPQAARAVPARPRQPSIDLEVVARIKGSSRSRWLAVGGGAVVVVGLVAWLATSSSGSADKAPVSVPTVVTPAEDKLSAIPPPPETTTAAQTAPPPPPASTTVAEPQPPIPTAPVTALPQAPIVPKPVAASPPRSYGAPVGPRPAPRPKGGQTIVRDVPF